MEDFHPQKPILMEHKPKGGLSVTVFSIVLFVLAFTLLFSDQFVLILFLLGVLYGFVPEDCGQHSASLISSKRRFKLPGPSTHV